MPSSPTHLRFRSLLTDKYQLPPATALKLSDAFVPCSLARGAYLLRAGAHDGSLYFIEQGLKQPEHMARSLQAQAAYRHDALVHHGAIDAGTGRCLQTALHWLAQHAARFLHPFLALQGAADELVATDGAQALRRDAAHDATLITYPEARHDLLLELGSEALADVMHRWISARARPAAALGTQSL